MRRHRRATALPLGTLAMILWLSACPQGEPIGPAGDDIRNYITGVALAGGTATAVYQAGNPPGGGANPVVSATGSSAMILGGGALRSLASATPFNRIIVAISGVQGYWQLTLPAPVSSQDVILTLAQSVPKSAFTVEYAGVSDNQVGRFATETVSILTVGTGPIQVSVSWDAESDVDLHLVEPGGTDIYYGNPISASGGTLDLDSNAACTIDGTKNENITWPESGSPPRGTYLLRVDYWDACGVSMTRYVVTLRLNGLPVQTFSGTLTGPGDHGGSGAGILVASFGY